MDLIEFKGFLKKFGLDDESVENYVGKNKLFENEFGIFLSEKGFGDDEVYKDEIIFVKLKKRIVSRFVLEFLKKNGACRVNLKSEKQALKFSYGKDINLDALDKKEGKGFYLVEYGEDVLGYGEFGKGKFLNLMNVGEYLKEE